MYIVQKIKTGLFGVKRGHFVSQKSAKVNTMEPLNLILRFRLIFLAEFLF